MKKSAIFLTTIFLAIITPAICQVHSDAGPDRVVCVDISFMDIIAIGGSPSASGGTPPYTYTWEASYIWNLGSNTFYFSASDFLNDTTNANPKVIHAIGDTIRFSLTVTDSEGHTSTDTTTVYYAYFGTHLGYTSYTINPGDSVFLYGWENVFGGFPPYKYLWRPNHGLTDSTSLAFWAKPEYSVAYFMTLTDSAGCVVTGAPVYYVNVRPLNTEKFEHEKRVQVYPNPVKDFLNIRIDQKVQGEFTFHLFFGNGQFAEELRFHEHSARIDLQRYPAGIYLYEISNNKGFHEQGRIIVN